jgi:hypothetical protein
MIPSQSLPSDPTVPHCCALSLRLIPRALAWPPVGLAQREAPAGFLSQRCRLSAEADHRPHRRVARNPSIHCCPAAAGHVRPGTASGDRCHGVVTTQPKLPGEQPRTLTDPCNMMQQVRATILPQPLHLGERRQTALNASGLPPEQKAAGSNPAGGTPSDQRKQAIRHASTYPLPIVNCLPRPDPFAGRFPPPAHT